MRELVLAAFAATMLGGSASAAELITNGQFNNGLAGWSTYTVNGNLGTPAVVSFDVTGSGTQNAARLQVGSIGFPVYGGGGLSQTITVTAAGVYNFSSSVAIFNPADSDNASGGYLSVLLDGMALSQFNVDDIEIGATQRGSLSFSTALAAGQHTVSLQALRNFRNITNTPYQYFTNVSFASSAVPEPATWTFMIVGFGAVDIAMRRKAMTPRLYA